MDLVESLRVHEHVLIAVLIEIVEGAFVDERLFQRVGGLVALVDLHAVGDAAHLELGHRRALAGMDVLGGQHDVELAVLLDDVALADIAGDDGNHGTTSLHGGGRAAIAATRGRPRARRAPRAVRPGLWAQGDLCDSPAMTEPSPWWAPTRHADRRPALIARGKIKAALRGWFEARGFAEVECGALAVSPGNEAHLHAFATEALSHRRRSPHGLSPHLAGIRGQEAARRRRDEDLRFRPRLPQSRARARCTRPNSPCSNGIARTKTYGAVIADTLALVRARGRYDRYRPIRLPRSPSAIRAPRPSG